MAHHPLEHLTVVGVRQRDFGILEGDPTALDALRASGVYEDAGVPYDYLEPPIAEIDKAQEEAPQLGVACAIIAEAVGEASAAGHAVAVTGGDCRHSVAVLAGLQKAYGPAARIGLVWMDAHGDYNTTHTSLSGMMGGMPVAVMAGLTCPRWREGAGIVAPLPSDRIILVDVRNLDAPEEALIRATDTTIAAIGPGRAGVELAAAVGALAAKCDLIYLHIDADIVDASLAPNHTTREPDGPDLLTVTAAIRTVMATGKVGAFALVSIAGAGPGSDVSVASGTALVGAGLRAWAEEGMACVS